MSNELATIEGQDVFHGLDRLIEAMKELAEREHDRFAAAQNSLFSLTLLAGQMVNADLNTADGAQAAQKAAAMLVNLGLEYLTDTLKRSGFDILSKNGLENVFAVGAKLTDEIKEKSLVVLGDGVLADKEDANAFYGLLPFELEHRIIGWSKFAPCFGMDEYRSRLIELAQAGRLIELAKHIPAALVTGQKHVPRLKSYEFIRWRFRRPQKTQPSNCGGIVDPLVWTFMIKCILGNYAPVMYRKESDRNGCGNWEISHGEIIAFAGLAVGDQTVLGSKIEKAMGQMDAFFNSQDALWLAAASMGIGWQERWGQTLQEIFLRLVAEVRKFYPHAPTAIAPADIDAFWASRVVIETVTSATSPHEHQAPRLQALLDCEMDQVLEPLSGFRAWPASLRQDFARRYSFTDRLIEHNKRHDFMNAGAEMNEILRKMSPSDEATTAESRALAVTGDPLTLEHAETVVKRLDLSRFNLCLVFGVYTSAPAWARAELLRRVDECKLSAKSLADIVGRGRSVDPEADASWFDAVFHRLRDTETLTSGRQMVWAKLFSHAPGFRIFNIVIRFCPEELFVAMMRKTGRAELRQGLQQLSPDELVRLARAVEPRLAAVYGKNGDADWLIEALLAETGHR